MHIIHITNNCNRGGSNHVILPVLEELIKKNIKFTFIYLQKPDILKAQFENKGIKTICIGKNPIKILFSLFKIIKNENKSEIIFHTHLVHASLIGRLAGKFFNIPVITTRHYEQRSKNNLFYLLEDLTVKYSNSIIAISKAVKNHLVNNYVDNKKCIQIYNPITNLFKNCDRQLNENEYRITFVGRLNHIKGIKYLIEAFEKISFKIPNSKLIIIGRDDGCKKELEDQIKKHPYKDRIVLTGFLSLEEIKEHLLSTNVYIQPSLKEGLGIAAMEAMAMECPCIFTKIGGLVELADNQKNAILIPDKNSKSISDAVIFMNENHRHAKMMAHNAKNFIINNFNVELISNKHYDLYKKILNDRLC
tara:strand:+ start:11022 stop:12107 length:1086 start_codon:yes stop_codon:yes gene_type:complete